MGGLVYDAGPPSPVSLGPLPYGAAHNLIPMYGAEFLSPLGHGP